MENTSTAPSQEHLALHLNDANFEEEITKFSGVALVDFWAEWCGPCHVMAPRIEELALKYQGNDKVKIGKLDIEAEDANQTAFQFRIMSLPTFLVFANGQQVGMLVGARPTPDLDNAIQEALKSLPH